MSASLLDSLSDIFHGSSDGDDLFYQDTAYGLAEHINANWSINAPDTAVSVKVGGSLEGDTWVLDYRVETLEWYEELREGEYFDGRLELPGSVAERDIKGVLKDNFESPSTYNDEIIRDIDSPDYDTF